MRLLVASMLLLVLPAAAAAQSISLDFGDGGSLTATSLQLIALITLLSLAPGIAIMVTCFPFIVTVLAILRQAVGLQQSPPNMLIVSLALFLTYFVMEPVFTEAWEAGVAPLLEETEIEESVSARSSRSASSWPGADRPGHLFRDGRPASRCADPRWRPRRRCRCSSRASCCPKSRAPSRSGS